jgi:hydrogenase expression/formation protein HypC
MCLAIPMQIDAIDGYLARCSTKGVSRDVNLFLLQDCPVQIGDYVLVHLGYAIQVLDIAEAERYWQAFDEVLAASEARADA